MLQIQTEIDRMIAKNIIETVKHEPDEILLNIFTKVKKDGTHSVILDLKVFNTFVSYFHFKMDSLTTITKLVD